jgi:hypothetical protein
MKASSIMSKGRVTGICSIELRLRGLRRSGGALLPRELGLRRMAGALYLREVEPGGCGCEDVSGRKPG